MAKVTHKVEVVPVVLEKHPNADRLSIVRVHNFTVVANTADWQGVTKAAYIQPDNVVPDLPQYAWLKDKPNIVKARTNLAADLATGKISQEQHDALLTENEELAKKYLRITVQKFRGIVSMGLLVPAPEGAEIGDDVAEALGVTHYDAEMIGDRPAGYDIAPAPDLTYTPTYDVESVYQYDGIFEPGELVYVTEKLDGQNCRATFTAGMQHIGSRDEWKKLDGDSNWARCIRQQPWLNDWCVNNPDRILYGETFGWVAKLKYGATAGQLFLRAFDILDGQNYLDAEEFMAALPEQYRVPCLGIMPFDFEKLQKLADGKSLIPGADHLREGIVIRPVKERIDMRLGRVLLKLVSNEYLMKY